jgi:hypothetical protein
VKMVTAGYPDMCIPRAEIEKLFGSTIAGSIQFRPDSGDILRWHGLTGQMEGVIETRHFFTMLGVEVTVLDISQVRGDEIIQDMNEPLAPTLRNCFDIVYDGGTMEHCFNVGQTVKNLLDMARIGGFIYHTNPLNIPNHGFYSFSPTFYFDFYTDNGHVLVSKILARSGPLMESALTELPESARFKWQGGESTIIAVAQKLHDRAVVWPIQTKYKKNPGLGVS